MADWWVLSITLEAELFGSLVEPTLLVVLRRRPVFAGHLLEPILLPGGQLDLSRDLFLVGAARLLTETALAGSRVVTRLEALSTELALAHTDDHASLLVVTC